jgi:hypothetical protein
MKKTNKENPLTFFRKANENRQKNINTSIKKAQDGIEMNDDLINKAGSTGSYKTPTKKWWLEKGDMPNFSKPESSIKKDMPWDSKVELIDPVSKNLRKDLLTPTREQIYQQKKGGTVKRKK